MVIPKLFALHVNATRKGWQLQRFLHYTKMQKEGKKRGESLETVFFEKKMNKYKRRKNLVDL